MDKKIILLFGLIFVTLFSARVFALTNVTSCQSLDTEDEIYYLTQNITAGGDCFDITASNVTLDCLGHQIYGLSSVSRGVGLWNTSDTVQNCIINNYGDGILSYSHDDIIRNNTITGSTFSDASGIFEGGTCHNTIYNNNLYNNSANLRFSVSPCSVDLIYNNIINGSIYYDGVGVEYFNTTEQLGERIFSSGMYIGGNYWTNSTGNGYSDTCTDSDHDGFCDSSYSPPVTSGSITDYLPLSDEYVAPPTSNIVITVNVSQYVNPLTIVKDENTSVVQYSGSNRTINLTLNSSDIYSVNITGNQIYPFFGYFNATTDMTFTATPRSSMTSSGDLLTDVGSGIGAFLSAITLGVTQIIVYIAIIMGVLTIIYAIAYLVSNAMHKK